MQKTDIFEKLKTLLLKYSPPFDVSYDSAKTNKSQIVLKSSKTSFIEGREHKELYFAGVIEQKSYVGFYYMPVYIESELKKFFAPELLKLLKGKSCFHIKSLDDSIYQQIKSALDKGVELYKKNNWV